MRRRITAWVLLVCVGCASAHEADEGVGGIEDVGPSLLIPMEPRASLRQPLVGRVTSADGDVANLEPDDATYVFAVGADYPMETTIELDGLLLARCSHDGQITLETVEGGGADARAEIVAQSALRLATSPGATDATFVVRGRYEGADLGFGGCAPAEASGLTRAVFEWSVTVSAREVAGATLSPLHHCREAAAMRYFAGSAVGPVRYSPVDELGRSFRPINATDDHPVTLALSTRDGSSLRVESALRDTIDGVILPDGPTTVDVSGPAGPSTAIEVLEPGLIRSVDPRFSILAPGPHLLDEGEVVDPSGGIVVLDRAFAELHELPLVDATPTCSHAAPAELALASESPEVCVVIEDGADVSPQEAVVSRARFGSLALVDDGVCRVRWEAPRLDGGDGLRGTFDFAVRNAELLQPAGDE